VYYLPEAFPKVSSPGIVGPRPILIKNIILREQLQILHGQSGTSPLSMMGAFAAFLLKIPYYLTEHSLTDFGDQ